MKLLSYPLGRSTPTFLENPPISIRQVSSIKEGGVANWFEIKTINHNGTHVDVPYHYWETGPTLTDLAIDDFVFGNPFLLDIPKTDGELITKDDLAPHSSEFEKSDLLLIRTGYAERYRGSEPERYGNKAPGFHSSAADILLSSASQLRGIIMDIPSASSPMHLDIGNEFHKEVLGATGKKRHLFLVEDGKLESSLKQSDLKRVFVVPLFWENLDASQCTVIAEPF
jgi:arylformamidase